MTIEMSTFSKTELRDIGKRLDKSIGKKEFPNPERDYPKAAKVFYEVIEDGYQITGDDVRRAIKLAKAKFSEEMIEEMGRIAEGIYYLKLAIKSPFHRELNVP